MSSKEENENLNTENLLRENVRHLQETKEIATGISPFWRQVKHLVEILKMIVSQIHFYLPF